MSEDIEHGQMNYNKKKRHVYPFAVLKKKGDYFIITDLDAEASLRSQASKQRAKRKIDITVEKTSTVNGKKRPDVVLLAVHCGKIK